MTWWLPKDPAASERAPLEAPVPSYGQAVGAAATARRLGADLGTWKDPRGQVRRYQRELYDELRGALGQTDDRAYPLREDGSMSSAGRSVIFDWRVGRAIEDARTAAQFDPDRFAGLPVNREQFEAEVTRRMKSAYDEATALLARQPESYWGPQFLGELGAELTDPMTAATVPFAAIGGGASLGGRIAAGAVGEGVAAGFYEAGTLEGQRAQAERIGAPEPGGARQVAIAATAGAIFGGVLAGGSALPKRLLEYRRARGEAAGDVLTPAEPVGEQEARIQSAGRALERGGVAASGTTSAAIPPVTADAPANWEQIRNGIFAGESGGDYDALFGFSNRAGGAFANVKLTQMTVDQAIEFANPRGPYAQWVRARVGRVATPMGAYQIVGTTLRRAKEGLGLRGDELMTPELQERLGQWIFRTQGTGAWEGYRGPRAAPPPRADAAAPPSFTSSRGYTGQGQVSTAAGTRIDVAYEVVDASILQRATGDLQPRDRSRIASDAWIAETAARLDPARLGVSPTADTGAPIVGPDNVIESGNGRFGAIVYAYDNVPDRGAAYRAFVEAQTGRPIPEGIERPVLIARRLTDLDAPARSRWVREAQDSGVVRMTNTELAQVTARQMTRERLATLDPTVPISDAGNGSFVSAVMAALPASERGALVDKDGALNAEGRRRIKEAFFARAWNDPVLIAQHVELEDAGDLKSLLSALEDAAPGFAALMADIEAGLVRPEFDISAEVIAAMRLIAAAREIARTTKGKIATAVAELLAEVDLLDGPVSPLVQALVTKFFPGGKVASREAVAAFLNRFAAEARDAGRMGGMFDDGPSVAAVLRAVDEDAFADLPEDFARTRSAPPPPPEPLPDLAPGAYADGALSPEAEAANAATVASLTARELADVDDFKALQAAIKDAQPFDTIDELYQLAPAAQEFLGTVGARVAADTGATFKNPGLKKRATAEEKMGRKRYASPRQMTDIARAGFLVTSAEQADQVLARLAAVADVVDEGWAVTPAGYFDRKVIVRAPNGIAAEVQIWSPRMLEAKNATGHELYERHRVSTDPAEQNRLEDEMRALYAGALAAEDPSFRAISGSSNSPKVRANIDANSLSVGTTRPVSNTSSASTGSQSAPGSISATADMPPTPRESTAGLPSQSTSMVSDIGDTSSTNIGDQGGTVQTASAMRQDAALADLILPGPDGIPVRAADVLADIEADMDLADLIDACNPKGGAQ